MDAISHKKNNIEKETTVSLIKLFPSKKHYILISLSTRCDVHLIAIDDNGEFNFNRRKDIDIFNSTDDALKYLKTQSESYIELAKGKAVLGYVVIGNCALLLLVENLRSLACLPGGHYIRTVTNAKWYRITCKVSSNDTKITGMSSSDLELRIKQLMEFQIEGAHWFCESADVSRPFPSESEVFKPCSQFVWNTWLSESFRSIGLGICCPALMQGTAESRKLEDLTDQPFNMLLLSRRSRLHPGTRHNARGLNSLFEPGNEIECEQIIWREDNFSGENNIRWNRFLWRRGTVPIYWSSVATKAGMGEIEIVIKDNGNYPGTKKYIRRLQKRFSGNLKYSNTKEFPIVFVSLLRKGTPMKKSKEMNLAEAFDKGLSKMRRNYKLAVKYRPLDWHEMNSQLGEERIIEGLWHTLSNDIREHGLASGICKNKNNSCIESNRQLVVTPMASDKNGKLKMNKNTELYINNIVGGGHIDSKNTSKWGKDNIMFWHTRQEGIFRLNCADSLDRTNVASFYISVQIFLEQCRCLGLNVITRGHTMTAGERIKRSLVDKKQQIKKYFTYQNIKTDKASASSSMNSNEMEEDLPKGWEAKIDKETGRIFYVDHINKKTSWEKPKIKERLINKEFTTSSLKTMDFIYKPKPWEGLDFAVEEMKEKVMKEPLSYLAEAFLINGDKNAFLYTGTEAMHSERIMIFEPDSSKLKKAAAGQGKNLYIATTRRINNSLYDKEQQIRIEIFLGLNQDKYFRIQQGLGNVDNVNLPLVNLRYKATEIEMDVSDSESEDDLNCQNNSIVIKDDIIDGVDANIRSLSVPDMRISKDLIITDKPIKEMLNDELEKENEEAEASFDPLGAVKVNSGQLVVDFVEMDKDDQSSRDLVN